MTRAVFRRKQGPQGEKAIKIPRSTGTGASLSKKSSGLFRQAEELFETLEKVSKSFLIARERET